MFAGGTQVIIPATGLFLVLVSQEAVHFTAFETDVRLLLGHSCLSNARREVEAWTKIEKK